MADDDVPQRLAFLAYQLLYPDRFTEAGDHGVRRDRAS